MSVRDIGCDMLTATSRKYLRGPRGVGLLYVRAELAERLEPPFIDIHAIDWERWDAPGPYVLREDARRFENWETNYAGKLGLGSAIDYALALDIAQTYAVVRDLAAELRSRLAQIPNVRIHDGGSERCGTRSSGIATPFR